MAGSSFTALVLEHPGQLIAASNLQDGCSCCWDERVISLVLDLEMRMLSTLLLFSNRTLIFYCGTMQALGCVKSCNSQ